MDAALDLIQIVDAALAEATRKAGSWLACKPGCSPCCYGPFPITAEESVRLRAGLAALDPERAAAVRMRARDSVARLELEFPGDTVARVLTEEGAADYEPCPALDPSTGFCDLYEARPITCRTFGPPLHFDGEAIGVCELCFEGASASEIEVCAVEIPMERPTQGDETIVVYALR